MSKAEERALEAYPVLMCYNDFQMVEEDVNKPLREIYQEGYHQAEKDLALTWEDIKLVHNITYEESRNVSLNKGGEISEKEFYKEVLKRFKNLKK